MEMVTVGKKFNIGKIAEVTCYDNDSLENINIENKSFLLLIITEGIAAFRTENIYFTAEAPCFVCFNEKQNPVLIKKYKLKCKSVYFNPRFLNINMSFELIRSNFYGDIAHTHDMFLLKPFIEDNFIVPIITGYEDKILETYDNMKIELEGQNDWYWSCRARSYFMELIILLERLYGMLLRGELATNEGNKINTQNERVNKALLFIESHYNESIILKDILIFCKTNHTTLGESFLREVEQTPIEYLWSYRIKISKKMLAFTEIPLKDISGRCEFKTVNHFSRIFKKQTGRTPAQFRKNALDERLTYIKTNKS